MNKEIKYAIKDTNGNWFMFPSYHGNESVILVDTKEKIQRQIDTYYKGRGFRVGKIIK